MRFFSLSLLYITFLSLGANFFGLSVYAQQQPDAFLVDVQPGTFDINTPVDITIKAVKANGEVIKDYVGDVFIDVEGSLNTTDYTVPSEGLYTFLAQDQGSKTFSKGLSIKKAGTFTVTASDITNDSIKGEKSVIVGAKGSAGDVKTVTITSPLSKSTEQSEVLEVIGSAGDLRNSPLELLLNNQSVYQGTTSSDGSFTAYITGLQKGDNTLQARVLDINDSVLGESDLIHFTYSSLTDGTFNGIEVIPGTTISAGTKVTFNVTTSDNVTSATIKLSNGRSAPMDLKSAGLFTKEIMIDTEGKVDVSLELMIAGQKKSYTNVTSVVVTKGSKIGKVRVFSDSVYKNKLTVTWEVEGVAPAKYMVTYGTTENNLNQSQTVTTKELVLEDLEIGRSYYLRVIPLDENGQELGGASDIIQAVVGQEGDASCTVQGIKVTDVQNGNDHYLMWDAVQNAEKYVVYRSEFSTQDIAQMQKVTETTDTKFAYPFNKSAKQDKYTYYVVQAVCKDGKALVVQDIKRVKTGPVENILLFVFLTSFLYSMYRLSLLQRAS